MRSKSISSFTAARLLAAALLTLPFATPHATQAAPGFAATIRTIIAANYARFGTAFQTKNIAAIDKMITVTYVAVGKDGKSRTRAQVLADYKSQMTTLQNAACKRTVRRMNVFGKSADVIVDGSIVGTSKGKDGKPRKTELLTTSEDTWIEITPTLWKLSRSHILKSKMMVDGKESPMH